MLPDDLRSRRTILPWLVLILLVLMAFGTYGLNMDMLWLDEVFSIGNIGGYQGPAYSPIQVWQSLSQNSPQHVPGYFFILGGWAALTGWTAFGLRALSLLLGLLAVAWTYRLGADWMSRRAGVYAAAVLALGAFFIYFTHEIRMYTMIAFLTVFVLWIYGRIATRHRAPTLWEWVALFAGALGLLYSHLFGALVLAAIGLYHLLFVPKNRRWWMVVAMLAVVGVSILPWLQVLLQGVRNVGLGEEPLAPAMIFTEMLHLFSSGDPVTLLLLAALAAAARIQRRRGAREVWFFLIVIFILTLVANEVRPMISEGRTRYLIHLWPLLALLVGLGLATLEAGRFRRWMLPLLAVWLAFGMGNTLNPQFLIDMDGPRYLKDYPPLREIVAAVNPLAEPEDLLITFSRQGHVYNIFRFFTVGAYHTQNLIPQGYFATLPETRAPVEVRGDLLNSLGTRLTVWFETEPITPPDQLALYRDILDERYVRCDSPVQRPDFVLDRYHLAALGCVENDLVASPLLHTDAGIDLHGLRAVVQDDQLLVAANWTVADSVPANTYSVSLKLWPADAPHPADGFLAQLDYGLRGVGSGWQFQAQPLDHVPPRDYVLTATLYNWSTGERLPLVNAAGEAGDELEIGSVTIEAES